MGTTYPRKPFARVRLKYAKKQKTKRFPQMEAVQRRTATSGTNFTNEMRFRNRMSFPAFRSYTAMPLVKSLSGALRPAKEKKSSKK